MSQTGDSDQGVNLNPTVELLYDGKASLGEGPFFEPETNQLLWVDIDKHTVNFLDLATSTNRSVKVSESLAVSTVIPVEGSDNILAAVGRKLCILNRETGKLIEEVGRVEDDKPQNRFNDVKCDPKGRVWGGTMKIIETASSPPSEGSLYRFSGGKMTHCVPDVAISNGLGWSLDHTTMYYIDSIPAKVYSFDFDEATGAISNQKVCVDYAKDDTLGLPDGMCTDSEGRLWVASFGGGRVTCWDPKTGEEIICVKIPAISNVTSCCFGGPDFEWLFVTTASWGLADPSKEPNAGGIFVIKDLGAKGLPANRFKN